MEMFEEMLTDLLETSVDDFNKEMDDIFMGVFLKRKESILTQLCVACYSALTD